MRPTSAIFTDILGQHVAKIIERDYIFAATPFMEAPTEETKRKAREFRERLEREGKVWEYLHHTADPKREDR